MSKKSLICLRGPKMPIILVALDYHGFYWSNYVTLAKTEIIYPKNVRAKVGMDFTY
jgi:hypothetical protein